MSDYFNEFFDAPTMGRGGARPNAGRKTRDEEEDSDYVNYGKARARKEAAQADKAEIEAAQMAGSIVDRNAVRDAVAKAFSTISQSLRAIPDSLERQIGLAPEIAEKVGAMIDEAMGELANELEEIHKEANAESSQP